jgi:hypothetical protein
VRSIHQDHIQVVFQQIERAPPVIPPVLWVPNWLSMSCDLGVFVDQPAESIAAPGVRLGR